MYTLNIKGQTSSAIQSSFQNNNYFVVASAKFECVLKAIRHHHKWENPHETPKFVDYDILFNVFVKKALWLGKLIFSINKSVL